MNDLIIILIGLTICIIIAVIVFVYHRKRGNYVRNTCSLNLSSNGKTSGNEPASYDSDTNTSSFKSSEQEEYDEEEYQRRRHEDYW